MFVRVKKFLSEVNDQMRKVTWPTREELIGSSVVVIVTTVFLAIYIGFADTLISAIVDLVIR